MIQYPEHQECGDQWIRVLTAEPEQDRARVVDLQAALELVDAGREQDVLAGAQLRVDRRRVVARLGDVEAVDGERRASPGGDARRS